MEGFTGREEALREKVKEKKNLIAFCVAIAYSCFLICHAWLACEFTEKDMAGFRYEIPLLSGSIFLLAGSLFMVWLIFIKKAKMSTIYLGMSFVTLSLFLWTQTPLHHHDNEFQYDSAYVLSNMLLGQEEKVGLAGGGLKRYYRRECDDFMHYCAYNNFILSYADMQREMFSSPKTEETQLVKQKTYQGAVSEPLYFYFPQAIGFCVARILELNVYWLLYLGRLFVAITCTFITWRAMKNTPAFQEIFLICGMLPTTIWSYTTVSRDALILAFGFYIASKSLQIVYGNEKAKWWDYLLLFTALLLLAPYKFVYVPLLLLLGLLVCKKGREGKINGKVLTILAAVVVFVAGFFVFINYDYLKRFLTGANVASLGEGGPFTIPYALANPGHILVIVLRTIVKSTVRFAANMIAIGDYGGGIHKEMAVIELLFIAIMILWNNRPGKNRGEIRLTVMERGIIICSWLAVSGMIYLAYLLLTPCTNDVIIGIQGRYFTPVLPLMIISCCGLNFVKNIKNKYWVKMMEFLDSVPVRQSVLAGIYGLALFVVVNMFVWVMTYVHPV